VFLWLFLIGMPHPIVFFLGGGCCGAGVVCCGFVVGFVYRSLLCRDDSVGEGMRGCGKRGGVFVAFLYVIILGA
jgi:hypothetical protein